MLFESTGIVNSVFEWIVLEVLELIVNRILIVSIVVNKMFSIIIIIIIIIIIRDQIKLFA